MDYEAEYNNRARVPEHPALIEDWLAGSARMRAEAVAADLGVPYGPSARQTLDIIWPDTSRNAPMVLFFHGGYWQSRHPRDVTFVAAGCLAHGVAVACAGYDLAPTVPVSGIIAQARGAAVCLYHRVRRPLVVSGHSAGGHLAAALTATRWKEIDPRGPDDMVPAGVGISGVYELEPLIGTRLNDALRLDDAEARRVSPLFWDVPAGRTFDAVVGGAESSEFLRQSRDLVTRWGEKGVATAYGEVEGANHFNVLAPLADPDSALVRRLVALARTAQ